MTKDKNILAFRITAFKNQHSLYIKKSNRSNAKSSPPNDRELVLIIFIFVAV